METGRALNGSNPVPKRKALFADGNGHTVCEEKKKKSLIVPAPAVCFRTEEARKTRKIRDVFALENASPESRLASMGGTPNGIRTHVSALRGRRPRPLDNGGKWLGNKDLNLDNTRQSRRCCRYTIPHHA